MNERDGRIGVYLKKASRWRTGIAARADLARERVLAGKGWNER